MSQYATKWRTVRVPTGEGGFEEIDVPYQEVEAGGGMSLYASYASTGSDQVQDTRVRFADGVGLAPTQIAVPMQPASIPLVSGQPCPGAHACHAQCVVHRPRETVFPLLTAGPGAPILCGKHPLFIWPGGHTYRGEWRGSKMHGQGILTFPPPDGGVYEGEFRDNLRHGKGKRTYAGGMTYEGEFRKNKKHGRGTFYGNGVVLAGEWYQDVKHGHFTKASPDGQKVTEVWRNGVQVSPEKEQSPTRLHTSKIQVPNKTCARKADDEIGRSQHVTWAGMPTIAFLNMIGKEIPVDWKCGEHFQQHRSNAFSVGEPVVVFRSNGTRSFGVVLKLMSEGSVDVQVSKGNGLVGPSHKVCLPEYLGKILDGVTPDEQTTEDSSRWRQELEQAKQQAAVMLRDMEATIESEREKEREKMREAQQRSEAEFGKRLREVQEQHAKEVEEANRNNKELKEHMRKLQSTMDTLKGERHTMGIGPGDYQAMVDQNRSMFLSCVQQMEKVKHIPVSIGVVGRTSAGKSSLLNKIFGTNCAVGATRCTKGVQEVCRYMDADQGADIAIFDVFGFNDEEAYESIETIDKFVKLHAVLLLYRDSIENCKNTIELFRAAEVKVVVVRSQIDTLELDALQEIEAVEAQKALQYGAHEWTKVTVKGGNTSDALKQRLDNLTRHLCAERPRQGISVSSSAPPVLRGILRSPGQPVSPATEIDIYATAQLTPETATPETVLREISEGSLSPPPVPTYLPTELTQERERHLQLDVRDLDTTAVASAAANPAAWTVDETATFFQRLSFDGAASVVRENSVDGKTMLDLTDDDLKNELGLQNLQVRRVRKEFEAMLEGGRG